MLAEIHDGDLETLFTVIAVIAAALSVLAFWRGLIEAGVGLILLAVLLIVLT